MAGVASRASSSPRDFSIVHLGADTTQSKARAAFQSKWDWVVAPPGLNPGWYWIVWSNLSRSYSPPEVATMEAVRGALAKGLQREAFDRLKALIAVSSQELSQVVGIPVRTVARRRYFKPDESERILRVAAAFQRSIEVLGSLEQARRWFATPKRALGEQTPLQYCSTELGAVEVGHLLGRIEHGVFS